MTYDRVEQQTRSETKMKASNRVSDTNIEKQSEPEVDSSELTMPDYTPLPDDWEASQHFLLRNRAKVNNDVVQAKMSNDGGAMTTQPETATAMSVESPNRTGMPDQLKAGLEQLSGMDLSEVRVHRNSSKPSQVQALAYTQGTNIYLGPGQERHLPHEGWHVVQQLEGRVKPTMQMKEIMINNDQALEKEADVMGTKAEQEAVGSKTISGAISVKNASHSSSLSSSVTTTPPVQRKIMLRQPQHSQHFVIDAIDALRFLQKHGFGENLEKEDFQPLILHKMANDQEQRNYQDTYEGAQKLMNAIKAKDNWRKLRRKVIGNEARVKKDVEKANIPKEMEEAAIKQTMVKRLVGSDIIYDKQWVIGPDGTRIQGEHVSKHKLDIEPRLLNKYPYASAEAAFGEEKVKEHLSKFPQAHAFISEWAYDNIQEVWKNWGVGTNFVTSLSKGNALFEEAKASKGIATLEEKLGIPDGSWSDGGKTSTIYRFIIKEPDKLNLRMPIGNESQAFQNEWVFGGKTLGSVMEAVVNSLTLEQLKESVNQGVIDIIKVTFVSKGVVNEEKINLAGEQSQNQKSLLQHFIALLKYYVWKV